mgnify:CR=1 FL=1
MIKRYECITEWPWYRPCVTDDGPWVSYTDHAEEIARLMHLSATRERMNGQTIATLRAENNRLADESHDARQAANGENALRLDAERERMNGQIQKSRSIDTLCSEIERWVKEVAHLKLAAEKAERESAS